MKYKGLADFEHGSGAPDGVLIANLGTPAAPDTGAVRQYLNEFLSDPRVIELPRAIWWLILHGIILRIRPPRVAKAYKSVWMPEGSPLLAISRRQEQALQRALVSLLPGPIEVVLGMSYGRPSIREALETLRRKGIQRLMVLPLYPQYSATTTGAVFDAVVDELKSWRWVPEFRMIQHYSDDPGYLSALTASVELFWREHGRAERLLFSFHGLPKRYLTAGDPYYCQCRKTGRLLAEKLGMAEDEWELAFQSRFGREEWLKPYTDHTLRRWGQQGIRHVQVVCPGFSADCLETLEEIKMQNRELFLSAGGERFDYIPALNDRPEHIQALAELIERNACGWPSVVASRDPEARHSEITLRAGRARQFGR